MKRHSDITVRILTNSQGDFDSRNNNIANL